MEWNSGMENEMEQWVGTKPGLWTLDWTMDWTMDWIMDWTMD